MTEKKLRIGLIGAGSSAANIAETISQTQGLQLTAISDINKDAAQSLATKYKITSITNDYKELCKRNDIDFVVISVPHALHYEITMFALTQGKHVLVEKPIATKVKDAEEMIALAHKKKVKLGVHFQNRFFDAVQEAKKIIDSGKLGKILQVNVSIMWYRESDYYLKSSWRGKWNSEGGGSLINQSIHTVDEMVYLVGNVKKLFGFWAHRIHNIEVDDNTCASFIFENGAFGTIQTSTSSKAAFPGKLIIFGSEGAIEIDGNILTFHKPDNTNERIDYAAKTGGQVASATDPKKFSIDAHQRLISDFRDAILNNREPLVNGEEGLRALKVVCAVYESNGEKIVTL
jgi:UDP-N-acetyl-2-amino-2-deoxyglucuronate dehydrogenase